MKMDPSKLILIIPASFVMVLLVIHSLRVNGPALTRKFFFWCFLFCYTKEFINANSQRPEYFSEGLEILNVPLMVPFGWVVAIYLSWFLAECLICPLGRDPRKVLPTVALTSIIIAFISLMVECSGGNMHWWWWNYDIPGLWQEHPVLKMPVKIIGGWATTCLIFFSFFMIFIVSPLRKTRYKALKIALIFVAMALPLGILATNLVWRHRYVAPIVILTVITFLMLPRIRDRLLNRDSRASIFQRLGGRRVLKKSGDMRGHRSLD